MKKYLKDTELWQKIFIFFLMVQPFLDYYLLYSEPVVNFFHFSPTTILRTLILFSLFFVIFFWHTEKKEKKIWICYAFMVGIYFLFHHKNAFSFSKENPAHFTYSILEELFYFLRMTFPVIVAFIVSKMKWNFKKFASVVLTVTTIISIVIIGSNLLGISLTSYGGDHVIKGNLFVWFIPGRKGLAAEWLASKGWFYMANQISGLLSLLLPLTVFIVLKNYSKKKLGVLLLQIIAMILIGTRVASIGWFLIVVTMLLVYAYMGFVKKELTFDIKLVLKVIACLVLGTLLLIKSPVINRSYEMDYFEKELQLKKEYEKKNPEKKGSLYERLSVSAINPEYYIELYPYKEHKKFWEGVLKLPYQKRSGNRNIEQLVTHDIYKTNQNSKDKWLGLSFSRMRSGQIYIERDFVAHYYTIGIVGILLLLGPYFGLLIWKGFDSLIHYQEKFTFARLTLLASICVTLALAFLSGHVVDELFVTIFLGFVCGLLLQKKEDWSK